MYKKYGGREKDECPDTLPLKPSQYFAKFTPIVAPADGVRTLSYIFHGVSLAGVSCRDVGHLLLP